jgi:hypothetical protein
VRAAAKAANGGREFATLTLAEQTAFLKDSSDVEWFPTALTCPGTVEGGQRVCPVPEKCRQDLYLHPQPALMLEEDIAQIGRRHQRGADRVFRHQAGGAGGAK